jgi:hypothetical protein
MEYVIFLVLLAALAFLAGFWLILEKAGQSGVLSLVPVYNFVVLLRVVGKPWWWVIPPLTIVMPIVVGLHLARCFGRSEGFGLGLAFLPFVFYPLLGLSNARFRGADAVFAETPRPSVEDKMLAGWNRFWFTPSDPTLLGLIRIACGAITFYTALAYSLNLQEFFGVHAWWDLASSLEIARDKPYVSPGPLRGHDVWAPPANDFQKAYAMQFFQKHGVYPFAPYPESPAQIDFAEQFSDRHKMDFRVYHIPFPDPNKPFQEQYLHAYTERWRQPPPPPYPETEEEAVRIDDYIERWGADPRRLYGRGSPVWSIFFHVTDPSAMAWVHGGIVLVTFLFMLGFCTRITSVLTWFGQLSYIHRANEILFGVDTMMTILLFYLMIGPSGAALSVDRWLARWWSRAKPRVVNRWRALWRLGPVEVTPAAIPSVHPDPSVSANVAIRMLQIHVCMIYLAAGLAKLLGQAWWNGTAVWGTVANYEFAPMQWDQYNWLLRMLGQNQLVFTLVFTTASYFTLFFEIGYAFMIWRPATRWLMLAMAITLHGFIGLFMGLKTFSLIMLVMNMAFLSREEARWIVKKTGAAWDWLMAKPPSPEPVLATDAGSVPAAAFRPAKETTVASTQVKRKK